MFLELDAVKVSTGEAEKLSETMSNWSKLHAFLTEQEPGAELLAKMIKVETSTRKRPMVAMRLLGAYHVQCREANRRQIFKAMSR